MNSNSKQPNIQSPQSAAVTTDPEGVNSNQQSKTAISPGLVVLQWLTYAFWGWALLSLAWLIFIVIYNLMDQLDTSEVIPYALSATLVLLPIALISDFFFSKQEPKKKQGASMVVMLIHAVIFALFAVGTLIGAIFAIVQLLIASGQSTEYTQSTLVSLLIVSLLYALTFLRTLRPQFLGEKLPMIYSLIMLFITGTFITLSILGPISQSVATRDDRRIVSYLPTVNDAINNYTQKYKTLPASLTEPELKINSKDAQSIIGDGLVEYKPEGKYQPTIQQGDALDSQLNNILNSESSYRYQLCVTFKKASDGEVSNQGTEYPKGTEYPTYLYIYDHPAGRVCYKLSAELYNNNY